MRIVLDLQAVQAAQGERYGQWAIAYAQALIRNRGTHDILIVLSDRFSDTIEPIRAAFAPLLPKENICIWRSPHWGHPKTSWHRQSEESIREAFLVSLQPDLVHLLAPVKIGENAPTLSIGTFTQTLLTAVTLFDLPVVSDPSTQSDFDPRAALFRQIDHFKRAHLWLTVSDASRHEISTMLGLPGDRVVSLDIAIDRDHPLNDIGQDQWDASARHTLQAFEHLLSTQPPAQIRQCSSRRPRLAYISPLPPVKSGIADYSAEVLPELSRHYKIDVIVAQDTISDPWVNANCAVHDVTWFETHAHHYDRVLYHMGNSIYHEHMFDLLERFPGVVMLHDFFLGHIVAELELQNHKPHFWVRELYHAHGYAAVQERFYSAKLSDVVLKYPCNLSVLQRALGVMVHSSFACKLANQWYGDNWSDHWGIVPMSRVPAIANSSTAREALRISNDAFVVCSFGLLGFTKQNHRLLDAWLASDVAKDPSSYLVFVGQNAGDEYGEQILETIKNSDYGDRIQITGWADSAMFRHYLAATDVAVQLRSSSRGETSAAAFDCMNYGLPMIVNACGSMAEFSTDAVWMLPEEFDDIELVDALNILWQYPEKRQAIGEKAQQLIHTLHTPRECADHYANVIESRYRRAEIAASGLIQSITSFEKAPVDQSSWLAASDSIAQSLPLPRPKRQLLLDVSVICQGDLKTGIQRVVRSLLLQWLHNPPEGYRVEPVYFTPEAGQWQCRYARQYTLKLIDCPEHLLSDDIVEPQAGDIFFGVDLTNNHLIQPDKAGLFSWLKNRGVEIYFTVYDLLPILRPDVFPPNTNIHHTTWLQTITRMADGVVCISRAVADEVFEWINDNKPERLHPFKIGWFHLGADIESSIPTKGLPDTAELILEILSTCPSFLMVGTIEPRKGYGQTLVAFEHLWARGLEVNLVMVGKQGWMVDALIDKINSHPELGKHLFWLEGISDEYLDKIYAACSCLIAASEGEGFGLPLIEAAQRKVPIIARDIPVFREVAEDHAYYFDGLAPTRLADVIQRWLALYAQEDHIRSDSMPWKSWKKSADQVLTNIFHNQWLHVFEPLKKIS